MNKKYATHAEVIKMNNIRSTLSYYNKKEEEETNKIKMISLDELAKKYPTATNGNISEIIERAELYTNVAKFIKTLPFVKKCVIEMRYTHSMTLKEIGK